MEEAGTWKRSSSSLGSTEAGEAEPAVAAAAEGSDASGGGGVRGPCSWPPAGPRGGVWAGGAPPPCCRGGLPSAPRTDVGEGCSCCPALSPAFIIIMPGPVLIFSMVDCFFCFFCDYFQKEMGRETRLCGGLVLWLHQNSSRLPKHPQQRLRRRMNPAKLFPFKGMRRGAGARDEASCTDDTEVGHT